MAESCTDVHVGATPGTFSTSEKERKEAYTHLHVGAVPDTHSRKDKWLTFLDIKAPSVKIRVMKLAVIQEHTYMLAQCAVPEMRIERMPGGHDDSSHG